MEETNVKPDMEFENEETEETEESPIADLQKIVSYNVANTIEVLKLKIDNEEINMKPEFQRDFVWDMNRASLFIDSLIIGLPIPSIFLGKSKEDENYMVIDGQQRLKSAYYYMTGSFFVNGESTIFSLKGLKKRDWDGLTYAELDDKFKKRIRNAVINTTIIEDINSRPKVVHDLFHRLNTGGMPLTDQEIRNCVYSGDFNKQILDLNRNGNWRTLLGNATPDRRLRDAELILRFFALLHNSNAYEPSMKIFLSNFQEEHKKDTAFLASNKDIFEKTVSAIVDSIGENAFRTTRSVNKSMSDAIMVSVAQILQSGKTPVDLKTNHKKLINDESFRKYTQSGTSTQTNVKGRIDLARNYFLGLK
jgi:antitoxin component of RelBE/YafQ-DinJ toxin-antitoxin module